ncbi:MAG TPA: phospho-sugar mutase [Polyangiaceae bacterium]|nr:phospho-sugar mutase [Polyangiaceae bacterium]
MSAEPAALVGAARAWLQDDPDPETRSMLAQWIESERYAELGAAMTPLTFGTAGLRAVEGPGPGCMNLAVVIRAARGLADWLERAEPDARVLPVVVGYDARTNSRRYAELVIRVLVAARLHVRYFDEPVPTPLVAFAARAYGAQAAVCITASHNPPEYAGLKVYAGNAVQIVQPVDLEIARAIDRVGPAKDVPLGPELAAAPAVSDPDAPRAQVIPTEMSERYLAELMALRSSPTTASELRIVYTPLHGVGGACTLEVLRRAGYSEVFPVQEQLAPDASFPTVRFPNPEEPGALDLALAEAAKAHADLVLAHDPDADRLAVCVPDASGEWRALSGNQVGVLLADYVLRRAGPGPKPFVVSSVVSSPMLSSIAQANGAEGIRTLTGFKWMLNAALELERERGWRFVYAYEEALGYCVRGPVRDKDGIGAGLLFADLVKDARSLGRSVDDLLEELYTAHGLWVSSLVTVSFQELREAEARLLRLRQAPPTSLAGQGTARVTDYALNASERPWYLGEANLLELAFGEHARVLVRPSGTEPKLKIYADFRQAYEPSRTLREQTAEAKQKADELSRTVAELLA